MANISISVSRHTRLRVLATSIPIILSIGITLAVMLGIPAIYDALRLALQVGGATFVWFVLAPASLMALVSTALAARALWRASDTLVNPQDR